MPTSRKALILLLSCALLPVAACETDQEKGVCFYRWVDDQGGVNQHCDAMLDSMGACEAQIEATVPYGADVTNWAWMPECADARCTGTCHPDWYAVYGGG